MLSFKIKFLFTPSEIHNIKKKKSRRRDRSGISVHVIRYMTREEYLDVPNPGKSKRRKSHGVELRAHQGHAIHTEPEAGMCLIQVQDLTECGAQMTHPSVLFLES